MEESKTMGQDHGHESRRSLPVGVGNDKRVNRTNKVRSDSSRSVNVFLDPSGREMEERSWIFNLQTAIKRHKINKIHYAGYNKRNSEEAACSNKF
jgi:hypothetical protein